ncbi:hypothetical protein [Chromobacterium violaceum]|uniref:hypothetical protein n=1 Tax=Chromobacterium violaceum TaxID=536 RepID=UPI0012D36959|nr:hypothetical protein [Chromobacterium violaceum]
MACTGSETEEPCIHMPNCHHFRPADNQQPGKKIASLVINVFDGMICEVLIKGDEEVIRQVIQENINRITSLLAA